MYCNIRKFKFTIIALIGGVIMYGIVLIHDFDIFEFIAETLQKFEKYELDELILFVLVILIAVMTDLILANIRNKNTVEIQKQNLETMKATMNTVQDIVGNALNGLQEIKVKVEKGMEVSAEDLEQHDSIIFETAEKLNNINKLEEVKLKKDTNILAEIDF